jgi:short subunit dehydrogenase-like uncharacterized protein
MPGDERYDLIVFGATSFVGQLVCRYLDRQADVQPPFRWAMAGRSHAKLEQVAATLTQPVPIHLADVERPETLAPLARQTRVLLSTVGPYALYGEPAVKACAEAGTDYLDLTGEVQWIRRMIDRYDAQARASGARIVPCCGFDSIPSDLGVLFLQDEARRRFGVPCSEIKMRVKAAKGGVSGGTIASMMNVVQEAAKDRALRRELANPYSLAEKPHPSIRQRPMSRPEFDRDFNAWTAPFVMAAINTRIVHRTNALLGYAYGRDFRYDEAMLAGRNASGRVKAGVIASALGAFTAGAALKPTRWLLNRFVLPKPGQGPSPEAQSSGFFDLRFFGRTADGRTLRAKVTGQGDPGYGSTSQMIGRTAIELSRLPKEGKPGGFWTPASLFGSSLIAPLTAQAGLSFEIME